MSATLSIPERLDLVTRATAEQCRRDHENHRDHSGLYDGDYDRSFPACDCGTVVTVVEVLENERYDPDHRELAPGEFAANHYRYPPHTSPEGRCTHTIELRYCAHHDYRALYGVHVQREVCDLWMD